MNTRFHIGLALIFSTLLLSACASKPIIDTRGVDMRQYQADLADCEQISRQVDADGAVARSAGFGALIGAIFGAFTGDIEGVAFGAGLGAVTGGVDGGLSADQERAFVTKNCLYNRGYAVLN